MESFFLMQAIQPLTEAIERLMERLESFGSSFGADVSRIDLPETPPLQGHTGAVGEPLPRAGGLPRRGDDG